MECLPCHLAGCAESLVTSEDDQVQASDRAALDARLPSVLEAAEALRLLYRWLTPIAMPIPPVTLVHASAAGLASLPGIVARLQYGTPLLLTEHGVYLRERYLAWAGVQGSQVIKLFATRVTRRLVELSYVTAEIIAPPVSSWNTRWEQRLGATPEQILTIANGVDPNRFTPQPMPDPATPTLVWVGRIDPLKDLLTLIEASALIRKALPQARVLLFGKAPQGNETYDAACRARVRDLGLESMGSVHGLRKESAGRVCPGACGGAFQHLRGAAVLGDRGHVLRPGGDRHGCRRCPRGDRRYRPSGAATRPGRAGGRLR